MSTAPAFQHCVLHIKAGERLFTEGDLGATMYVVQSGKIRLFRLADGQKRIVGTFEKGDFFGETSILEGLPRSASAEAIEDSDVIEINGMTFDKMIRGNIEIAIRMLRKLSSRLREAERRIETLETAGSALAAPAPTVAPRPANPRPSVAGQRLEVEGESMVFPLTGAETLIGRFDPVTDLRPDVDLTPVDLKRSVSRRHARIVRTDEGYFITEEVGALNGTFVNGTKLVTGRPQAISDGDRIGLGMVKLVFRS